MTTTLIALIIAVTFVVLLRLISDRRHVAAIRHIQRHALRYATTHDTTPISIIIEVTDSVDAVIPLLDRIHSLGDGHVAIYVTLASTAEPTAATKLAYFRKKQHRKNITVIKLRKNTTYRQLLARRITGDIVMRLNPESSLSHKFFQSVRLAFLDHNLTALTPRRQTCPDNRLVSGLQAGIDAWQQLFHQLFLPPTPAALLACDTAYRRNYLLNPPKRIVTARTVRSFIILRPQASFWQYMKHAAANRRRKILHIAISLFFLALITAGITAAITYNNQSIYALTAGSMLLLYLFNQVSVRGLSWTDHLSILLLAPFVILLDFFITFMAMIPIRQKVAEPFIEL